MGNLLASSPMGPHWFASISEPETTPKFESERTFDPQLGFEGKRKERVMLATKEEMVACGIPPEDQDFCAHLLIKYRTCMADNTPWFINCTHERDTYLHCKHEE